MVEKRELFEKIARCEERIKFNAKSIEDLKHETNSDIKELKNDLEKDLKDLKDEFEVFKQSESSAKKHKEGISLTKLGLILVVTIAGIEIISEIIKAVYFSS